MFVWNHSSPEVGHDLAIGAVLRPLRDGVAQVLSDDPVEVLPILGAVRRPSTLSSERFSNSTTTILSIA